MHLALRPFSLPLAVLAATALTACGSSSKDTAAAPQASGTTSTSSSPSPTPSPSAALSKAAFVAKMDAVCVDVTTKLQSLPKPTGEGDYATLAAFAQSTLALYPPYIKQAETLVGQTADKDLLTTHWLTLEKSDYAAQYPVLKKFVADVKAKDQAALAADAQKLDTLPDHSDAIAGFLSGYGLKSCAILQRS